MPTGYTANIIDGKITKFEDFAKQCVRAFGVAIHMRDEDMDMEYTPRVPSDYHIKAIENLKSDISEINSSSDSDILYVEREKLLKSLEHYNKQLLEIKKNTDILNSFLNKAKNFEPPTHEHVGIKDFMIKQLSDTIDFDSNTVYYDKEIENVKNKLDNLNANDIRKTKIESYLDSIKYHENEYDKEVSKCNDSNKWVKEFLEALK